IILKGGTKLQLVFGDITNETTDAVVNTTNFNDFLNGSKKYRAILNDKNFLSLICTATLNRGEIFVTQPGKFPCKNLLHVWGKKDASLVEELACSIIEYCEKLGFASVAIPAIYFTFPLYWDNMASDEAMKVVPLQPNSEEYRRVEEGFKRTANKTIERLQNIHLRRAYEVQKKQISQKNKHEGGANEKFLYHGTTQDNCNSIMTTGFNRRFSGQNATSYGKGTYFAVDASYSCNPTYSRPAADGSQLMFVVRVLTGVYTLGHKRMRVPPPRDEQQPQFRYDSVVDRMDRPNMFVVFHDNQAYPDYLITFKPAWTPYL
uniref:Poly [ADP-ribose] polymerase n=1 Tax=Cyprinodon variegatus TaxID=28743 RepID=A0A3Q2D0V0_CYPVA